MHALTYSLAHPHLPTSPSPPTPVFINCCLHLLSLQNCLTALEVARARADSEWSDQDERWDDKYRMYQYKVFRDYDGVVDLLSAYTAEPAALPSHPVSGTITTSSH